MNDQITDAVTQSNVKILSEAPSMAMGSMYQSAAHSSGILMENAVASQQAGATLLQAVVSSAVKHLMEGRPS
ncbi:RebB family R body protein [Thalassovita aquimarina]|uniref:RebB family R body protein n=1 Tax=Thalassovita aquimarina TaxID=2785917 RepID=UPI0035678241